jgi:hypothetical protein
LVPGPTDRHRRTNRGQGNVHAAVLIFASSEAELQQGRILHSGGNQMAEGIIKHVKEKRG